MVLAIGLWRSGCGFKSADMVLGCSRWGSESEAFAFQSRTGAIHIRSGGIGSWVENSAIDVGLLPITQSNAIWAADSLISVKPNQIYICFH